MNIKEAIINRQTIRKFTNSISDEAVKSILEDAVYAPNHGHREPWRFILINNEKSYEKLVKIYRKYDLKVPYMENYIQTNDFPTMLVVIMKKDEVEKKYLEDYLAHGSLIQNIQLLAWNKNIGVVWKTYFLNEIIKREYGIKDDEVVTGFLLMGTYDQEELKKDRTRRTVNIEQ